MFEYHWRTRPVRSFVTSMRLALRPQRLWQHVDIHDRPPVKALVGLAAASILLTVFVALGSSTVVMWATSRPFVQTPTGQWAPGPLQISDLWRTMLEMLATILEITPAILSWCGSSFLALIVFRQSMRLCKVRTGHVVRVWAYAVPLPMTCLSVAVVVWAGVGWAVASWAPRHELTHHLLRCVYLASPIVIPVGFAAFVIWSIWCGYRHYIGMRHAFWVALAAQVMAVLLTATVLLAINELSRAWGAL